MEKKSFFKSVFGLGTFSTTYMRIVWQLLLGSLTTLFLLLTLIIIYFITYEGIYEKWFYPNFLNEDKFISDSSPENNMAPFCQKDKWGYINLLTDESIPAQFEYAWPFSEGIAAVIKNNRLVFINLTGEIIINTELGRKSEYDKCEFTNGYCIVNSTEGLTGLIDKQGNWALQPIYDDIFHENGFWKATSHNLYGLFSAELDTLLTVNHPRIEVKDEAIEASSQNHIVKRYDYNMNILEDFVIYDIDDLLVQKIDKEGNYKYDTAKQMCYSVNAVDESTLYYGLMDKNGKRITPPEFTSIEAIDVDLYLCMPQGIVINGKGIRIE